jgi:hypothetical protein
MSNHLLDLIPSAKEEGRGQAWSALNKKPWEKNFVFLLCLSREKIFLWVEQEARNKKFFYTHLFVV